ncbi:phospholipase D-like domain-containing protein [Nocardioides lijunqiniae]|uniref:phospholipase D-like domain-containing protein n=1 Tax=Nocardioides lijunqiniae TaxID=2760832 RepID=UPI001878B3FD|nr:phospholipase D-like domain-containing protein [Nocardioides lijunqiniae]
MSRHLARRAAAVTALSVALGLSSAATSPAPAAPGASTVTASAAAAYSPTARSLFGRPGANGIRSAVLTNIANAPRGSVILGNTWTFTDVSIAQALASAHARGVRVRVLVAAKTWDSEAVEYLRERLGSGSYVKKSLGAARKATASTSAGAMHQKSWLFSRTGSQRFVSIVTSANATDSANETQFNDGYQFVDYPEVYSAIQSKFYEQVKRDKHASPFDHVRIGKITALTFSPWDKPTMRDPVVRRIRQIPAAGAEIRVANAAFYGRRGEAIAQALAAKKAKGAKVWVLHGRPFGAGVKRILRAARIPMENAYWTQGTSTTDDDHYLHSKMMTAKYRANGKPQWRVWTGSENWSADATAADELVAQVGAGKAYSAHVAYFTSVWKLKSSS